jgi:hypothetical protein
VSKAETSSDAGSRSILFAGAAALALAVVSYSFVVTTAVDASLGIILTTIGISCGAFLILTGYLAPEDSSKGLVAGALKLLPTASRWASASPARLTVCIFMLAGAAIASYWVGPAGIQQVSVACDEATRVQLGRDQAKNACAKAFTGKLWRSPQYRVSGLNVTCLDAKDNGWRIEVDADGKGKCGARPRNPLYVTNGIERPPLDLATVVGHRTHDGLQRLSLNLKKNIGVDRAVKDRLLFATWNLREFGRRPHLEEADAYIAEIISHFDIVALQEIRGRPAIDRLMRLLGPDYKLALSFVSPGACGLGERLAFIYDTRKVKLDGVASNVVVMSKDDTNATSVTNNG